MGMAVVLILVIAGHILVPLLFYICVSLISSVCVSHPLSVIGLTRRVHHVHTHCATDVACFHNVMGWTANSGMW